MEEQLIAEDQNFIPAGAQIELPYHLGQDKKPIRIQLEQPMTQSELQQMLNTDFPRTGASIALQMMDKGAEPVSKEDFDFVKEQSKLMDQARRFRSENEPSMLAALADQIPGALKGIGEGILATGKAGLMLASSPVGSVDPEMVTAGQRAQINGAGALLEGLIQGTERLVGIGKQLGNLMLEDEYGAYRALKQHEATEMARQAGQTVALPLDPEAAKEANKVSQFLDATILLPIAGKVLGSAGKVAAAQAVEQLAKQSTVGITRRVAGNVLEKSGALASQLIEGSTNILGEAAGKGLVGDIVSAVGGKTQILPKAAEWAGKAIKAESASAAIAEGIAAANAAGRSGALLRGMAKVMPPDSVIRAAGTMGDSMLLGGALGAGISAVQAASDPFNTGMDVAKQALVGGATGTTLGAFFGTLPAVGEMMPAARNRVFVQQMAKDITERPTTRSFIFGDTEYAANDAANRTSLLNRDDMSTTDKARIFAVTKSAEHGGHDVVFVDNTTVLPDELGGVGDNMGRGARVMNDNEGRSTILINVDQINPAAAVEEVAHAFIGNEAAKSIVGQLIKDRGGVSQALEPLVELGRRYVDTQMESNPEAAARLGRQLSIAEDVTQTPQARASAAVRLAEEWAGMGIGELLSTADPRALEPFRGTPSIWAPLKNTLTDIFSGLMTQPSAASKDPITGFFYKDGKLIRDKTLEKMADTLKESILRGKNLFPTDVPQILQGRRPTKGKSVEDFGVNVGDTLIDGTTVLDTQPRPRYEDTHAVDQKSGAKAGSATNKRRESRKEAGYETYHNLIFNQVAQIVGESVVDPGMVERGAYAGNLTKVPPGSPIISTKSFTDSELNQLFQVQTHHGRPLIAPEAREAVARVNDAAKHSNIISVDYDMRLGKGDKDREYAMRVNQIGLVTGMQQTPTGGLVAGFYNMSLLNEIANYQRSLRGMEVVDKALRDFGISSLDDFVPLVKAHIENYSLGNAVPAVDLYRRMYPGVSKESASVMRDLLHLSSGLQPRVAFPGDVVVNQPKIAGPMLPPERQVKAYDVFGKERPGARVYRDRNVLNEIRLDSIHNAQLYAGKGGLPVKVDINLSEFIPNQRSNFSPKRSINERMGESNVITDTDTGRRAFVLKSGVTKVFNPDGSLQGVYDSLLDAQTKLNRDDIRFSPKSPAAVRRAAEKAQELRGKMEAEAPSRLMATWLSELAAQKAQAAAPAQPQRAKGKLPVTQAELAAIGARSREIAAAEERFPGMAQLSSGQRAIFLRDLAEAESGITARALARIAEQSAPAGPRARRAAAAGQLSQAEQAALKANVDAKLAARDVPVLEADEVRELFSRKRQRAPRAALEASAMSEVPAEFFKRDMPVPQRTQPGVYRGFEALSDVGLPREMAPVQPSIKVSARDLLAEGKAQKNLGSILGEMAQRVRQQPPRQAVPLEPKKVVPPPPDPIITPAQEPHLPNNMVVARTPKGNFKLFFITQQGKAIEEAVSESYGDILRKAQRKAMLKRYSSQDEQFLKSKQKAYATP